jgi:hypothetical protein
MQIFAAAMILRRMVLPHFCNDLHFWRHAFRIADTQG